MDPYFLADYEFGNIGFVMPFWAWIGLILTIVILCFRWGFGKAKKTHAKRSLTKFFGRHAANYSHPSERAKNALTSRPEQYLVIEAKPYITTPLTLWKVMDLDNGKPVYAIPVQGYNPGMGDKVQLMRWICEGFDSELPAVIYFMELAKKDKERA